RAAFDVEGAVVMEGGGDRGVIGGGLAEGAVVGEEGAAAEGVDLVDEGAIGFVGDGGGAVEVDVPGSIAGDRGGAVVVEELAVQVRGVGVADGAEVEGGAVGDDQGAGAADGATAADGAGPVHGAGDGDVARAGEGGDVERYRVGEGGGGVEGE